MRDIVINSLVASAVATLCLNFLIQGSLSGVGANSPIHITVTPLGAFVAFAIAAFAYLKWRGH